MARALAKMVTHVSHLGASREEESHFIILFEHVYDASNKVRCWRTFCGRLAAFEDCVESVQELFEVFARVVLKKLLSGQAVKGRWVKWMLRNIDLEICRLFCGLL
ncbi:hypothetical protein HELRODRAFT_165815 [Helobdella robusta]|uniref:Uncharacterized protein n=1 Tax=Helobdella robusta TaxID=6412 RepID=T1EXB4_HELRO|nr:hypothetical protein HELRODRAFT_165815 [Helobdella robusta]ESN91747.1 hypothetical protein HELRODRAFT_165815 [Helobdella robusta]